jgi:hypothetical protein
MAVIILEEPKTGLMKQHSDCHNLGQAEGLGSAPPWLAI